jgi:hypothetical protein
VEIMAVFTITPDDSVQQLDEIAPADTPIVGKLLQGHVRTRFAA